MAKVGAQRAAELTGKSKSTIQRAMKSGKISYEMDNNGRRVIDVAELERAFGLVPQEADKTQSAVEAELEKATQMLEIERLKMRIKMLEEQLDLARDQIEDVKEQRDQWQKQAQQVLLTSEYSQKQAEEYKAELKERERRARERRQQMEQRVKQAKQQQQRQAPATATDHAGGKGFDAKGLWQKLRGQNSTANSNGEAELVLEEDKKAASA